MNKPNETNWHTKTMEKMKTRSIESLQYIIKDAGEASAIAYELENPVKGGQYADEVHYAVMELNKRKKGNV